MAALLIGLPFLMFRERSDAAGGPGYALRMQGSASVAVPHHAAFNTLPLTVTAWSQTTGILIGGLVTKATVFGFSGWRVSVNSGELAASYQSPNGSVGQPFDPLRAPGFGDNRWHHVAFVVDVSGGRLYVDGILRDSRSWDGVAEATTGTEQVVLGGFDGGGGNYDGLLDEVTIWNLALSESQIRSNMNRSLSGLESGLVAYYRCDDLTGPVQDSAPLAGNQVGTLLFGTVVPSTLTPFSPGVETLAATLSNATATLNGTVHPAGTNTWVWFEWGTTTNHGSATAPQSVGSGTNQLGFSHDLGEVPAGATYHFRAVASNAFGLQGDADREFHMPAFHHVASPVTAGMGTAAWGDFDADGRLDLVWHGFVVTNGVISSAAKVLRNTGSNFGNVNAGLPPMNSVTASWGDADNDGLLDVLRTGGPTGSGILTEIWRHTGMGFSNVLARSSSDYGSSRFGDVDNNGRLDVLYSSADPLLPESCSRVQVLHNEPGAFLERGETRVGSSSGVVFAFGDYDNDGRLDVIWSGTKFPPDDCASTGVLVTELRRNLSKGFTDPILTLPALSSGLSSIAWGDYDNDGLLDLLFAGAPGTNQSQIWQNTGNTFSNINAAIGTFMTASAEWGDYDNDGRLDILLAGLTTEGFACEVWRNTSTGFSRLPMVFPASTGFASWGDYDNDGRLDIVLTGMTNNVASGAFSQIWRNITPGSNTPPTAPSGLAVAVLGTDIVFSWSAASDAETPALGLTYNLRVGTAPGQGDVVAPMSLPTGLRLLPAMGNAQKTLFRRISGLPLNRPLYWSVQAVDTGFRGGPFAPENALTLSVAPSVPGSNVAGDMNGDGMVDRSEVESVLAHYLPSSPWLLITNSAASNAEATFTANAAFPGTLNVESSMAFTNWQTVGPATPFFSLRDTNAAAAPQRHYRLRLP